MTTEEVTPEQSNWPRTWYSEWRGGKGDTGTGDLDAGSVTGGSDGHGHLPSACSIRLSPPNTPVLFSAKEECRAGEHHGTGKPGLLPAFSGELMTAGAVLSTVLIFTYTAWCVAGVAVILGVSGKGSELPVPPLSPRAKPGSFLERASRKVCIGIYPSPVPSLSFQ